MAYIEAPNEDCRVRVKRTVEDDSPELQGINMQLLRIDEPEHAEFCTAVSLKSEMAGNGVVNARKKGGATTKKKNSTRSNRGQRDDSVKKTVYIAEIDHQVTEESLALWFAPFGQVVDCRICGDPHSTLRFAFVEFTTEEEAKAALHISDSEGGYDTLKVLPSKTAIMPVNPTFLPRSETERDLCARTIYCTNIDKKVTQADVKLFFDSLCGEVTRLRLLGDFQHSTRIAFVEFFCASSAQAALNCSGAIIGTLAIRVSPSKTPVRPRAPRPSQAGH